MAPDELPPSKSNAPLIWLIAWDGSPSSDCALLFALDLHCHGDKLIVYHCSNPGRHVAAGKLDDSFHQSAMQERLKSMLKKAGDGEDVHKIYEVFDEKVAGHDDAIAERILMASEEHQADVLCLGSSGYKGSDSRSFQKYALGKAAHQARLHSPRPPLDCSEVGRCAGESKELASCASSTHEARDGR